MGAPAGGYPRECMEVAAEYVGAAAGRAPVIVQVGHDSLAEAKVLAAHAANIGADAISATLPKLLRPRGSGDGRRVRQGSSVIVVGARVLLLPHTVHDGRGPQRARTHRSQPRGIPFLRGREVLGHARP